MEQYVPLGDSKWEFEKLVMRGQAQRVLPTTDSGWKTYGNGRLFLPAATNLCTDPQGTAQTFWPSDTANTDITPNVAVPVAVPGNPLITKCLQLVNDGTADAPVTVNLTVVASTSYNSSIYVYAPTLGGNLTITVENGHTFSLAALTAANSGFVPYSVQSNTVAGEVVLGLKLTFAGGTASTVYVTGCDVVAASVATPHFDGTYDACAWTGTANASTSTRAISLLNYSSSFATFAAGSATIGARTVPLWAGNSGTGTHGIVAVESSTPGNPNWYIGKRATNTWRAAAENGAQFINSAALSFAAGTAHSLVGRFSDSANTIDLIHDGTAVVQGTTAYSVPTQGLLLVGATGSNGAAPAAAYVGPAFFSPSRLTDAEAVTLDAMLLAGASGLSLFRFFRERSYTNTLILGLNGDSVGYLVT